jgi:hypothetical protein
VTPTYGFNNEEEKEERKNGLVQEEPESPWNRQL